MNGKISLQKRFLDILESFEKEPILRAMCGFSDDLQRLKQRMQDDVFRIAVVGQFSSGKSTFINALLGKDVLSHASRETTAVLTQIVNVPPGDARIGTGLVRCKDGTQQKIRMEELREYTTTMSTRHAVADEIECVDIYTPLLHAHRPLMMIDTPGLNGIASGHLDQTMRVVQEAHACIYLIQQRGLSKEDLAFLRKYLLPNQQHFIFVQNFIDAFKAAEGESVEQRLPLLEKMLREEVFAESEPHEFYLCGVSALKELVGQDRGIRRLYEDSAEELDDLARAQLRKESNFASFRSLMEEKFDECRLAEIQHRGTANAILRWTKDLTARIAHRAADANEVYEVSREHRAIEKLSLLQERLKGARAGNLTALDGFIAGRIRAMEKELTETLAEGGERTEQEIGEQLDNCPTLDAIQRKKGELPTVVVRQLGAVQQEIAGNVGASMQLLHQMLVERVEEYSGIAGKNVQVQPIAAAGLPTLKEMETGRNTAVEARKQAIADLRAQEKEYQRALAESRQKLETVDKDVRDYARQTDDAERTQRLARDEMRRMGCRPAERVWEENIEVERGGFFGSILDFFSTKTEPRTMRDDSEGEAWDEEHRRLQERQNRYAARYDDLRKKKAEKERLLRRYQADAAENEARIRRLEQELRTNEELLRAEQETDEKQRELAMQAYLKQCRKQLGIWVHRHLHGTDGDDGELQRLTDAWKENLAAAGEDMQRRAHALYEEAVRQKIAQLEQAKQEKSPVLMREVQELTRVQNLLEGSTRQMEGDLA